MRRFFAILAVLVLIGAVGCNHWPYRPNPDAATQVGLFKGSAEPSAAQLVAYLNDNSQKVSGLQCATVTIDAKQGNSQPIGMDAIMACEKSRDFRMKAKVAGQNVADFGSNQDEFWYYISKADPPYVVHGKYADMKNAAATLPIPFQPDLVIAALGIGEYDPNAKYEVRSSKETNTVELIEPSVSIQGKPVWKVTVFNRGPITASRPLVLAYLLKDEKGKDIAIARVLSTEVDPKTKAVLPRSLNLTLVTDRPDEKVEMKMTFTDLKVVAFDNESRGRLFSLSDVIVGGRQGFDLVSGRPDGGPGMGTSIQRTNATSLPSSK